VVFAQATAKTLKEVTCAADGSSTQVFAAAGNRLTWSVINTAASPVRIGFLATGTADLTGSNSIQITNGGAYGESYPTVFLGRIVCMSTTAGTTVIQAIETRK
jgi:hypothetical protein